MFEEALAPFLQYMERYRMLGLPERASACCLGILQGIYDFDEESSTQYKEWAVDAPRNSSDRLPTLGQIFITESRRFRNWKVL